MGGAAQRRVSVRDTATEAMMLAARRKRVVIRHQTGDRIVALIEVVSPGNKDKRAAVEAFVDKAIGALDEGYHLLVLDLLPPRSGDPRGMHGAIWGRLGGVYDPPAGRPLTLAAYAVAGSVTCYVEPTVVGVELLEMPLFLDPRGRRSLAGLMPTLPGAKLIATHDLEFVVANCPRVLVLDGGRLVADGPTRSVLSDAALYAPFALVAPFSGFWVGTVIVLAGISEFAGALGPTVGASRRYDGPMGKSDRAFVFGALGLYVALGWPLAGCSLPAKMKR